MSKTVCCHEGFLKQFPDFFNDVLVFQKKSICHPGIRMHNQHLKINFP